ncbi:hypothetical protein CJ030_MR3G009572 [Morella rubra]|uniref:Uncharacterized protein n=1 Tax=Morella rubra TaxID=262757 RepID=A0A6A1WAU6_9ROSI|nr:hypothetical protein CJ030_MR3G009572 [Morella rubra]
MLGVKRARTTRTGTLERRMEYLRGRPVAKERLVTLSDFDQLLYKEHSLYQLFEHQGFLHQLSWTEGFCVDVVVQDFFSALISVDRAPEVQLEDHFDLDYTRHEDVRTVVKTMMTACRTHRNRMHAYFKKFPSKEAALLKPHPDSTEEQWKELCDLFTSKAFIKNEESSNINPAKLYKKNYTKKDGIWTSEGAREIYHQLAKARDEIEAMRAAREKDLQEFAKKQAEMEATLRDHREEQWVEQERIRLEQEERMKREQEHMRVEHEERMQQEKSACERSKSAYRQKYQRNWRRKCPL